MELEYVRLACKGMCREEIASRMYRSPWTIVNYQESVRSKTQSKTMAEAVAKLYDHGILQPSFSYEIPATDLTGPQATAVREGPEKL